MTLRRSCFVASLIALAAVLAGSGCAGFPMPIEQPQITPRSASLRSSSPLDLVVELELDVYNPNSFGVPLDGASYEVALGGARAMNGDVTLSDTLPARGSTRVVVPVHVNALDAVNVTSRLAAGARDIHYHVDLRVRTAAGTFSVPVDHAGSV